MICVERDLGEIGLGYGGESPAIWLAKTIYPSPRLLTYYYNAASSLLNRLCSFEYELPLIQ